MSDAVILALADAPCHHLLNWLSGAGTTATCVKCEHLIQLTSRKDAR